MMKGLMGSKSPVSNYIESYDIYHKLCNDDVLILKVNNEINRYYNMIESQHSVNLLSEMLHNVRSHIRGHAKQLEDYQFLDGDTERHLIGKVYFDILGENEYYILDSI